MSILDTIYFGNTVQDYLICLAIFVGLLIVFRIFKTIVVARLKKVSKQTKTEYDDSVVTVLEEISWLFYVVLSLFLAIQYLAVSEAVGKIAYYIFIIVLTWQVIKSILVVVDVVIKQYMKGKQDDQEEPDKHKIFLFSKLIKIIVWVIGILLVLSNLGYNITTLIAGLGVGGIAVALAMQNVLEDIFSSFSIYMDQPFKVGDYIVVGDKMGTVTKIGIKTTRLTSVQGEEVVISNRELTNTHIRNYRKIEERRAQFALGVAYETSNEKLKKIPAMIEEIINATENCRFDRATFKSFGDFSLNFDIVFYYKSNDYVEFLKAQEKINLAIKEQFENNSIEFAYPTQTVFVKKQN